MLITRYIYLSLLILCGAFSSAQTAAQNYTQEIIYKQGRNPSGSYTPTVSDFSTTTYYDGWGRPVQQVQQNASPVGDKNIVTHIEYEPNRGQTREYLPFTAGGSTADYVADGRQATLNHYNDSNPYSENLLEGSLEQRVLETGAPGFEWSYGVLAELGATEGERNTIRYSYALNAAGEVKKFEAASVWNSSRELYTSSISENGYYAAGSLKKTVTRNENWKTEHGVNNTAEEFTGADGKVVLKRTYDNGVAHDTYYVYDFYGNLAYVIPPLANASVAGTNLDNLCYQYLYDEKNRVVEKKLPQKSWEFIVYDRANRIVFAGPVNNPFSAAGAAGWIVTKYDNQGRTLYTGFYSGHTVTSANRKALRTSIYAQADLNDTKTTTNTTIDGVGVRYTNSRFPTAFNLLTVNYYDDYVFPGAPASFAAVEGATPVQTVKGLSTGSWVRVMTTAAERKANVSYTLYNMKYQPIRTYTATYLGGYQQTDSRLTFRGLAEKTVTAHKKDASATVLTVTNNYTYDHRERLKTHTQQINAGPAKLISENVYDDLGVLQAKKVGGSSSVPLQTVNYKYNIRGWLTDINNANQYAPEEEVKLFNLKLNYNKTDNVSGTTPLYNGNISSVLWRTRTDGINRANAFEYDHLNRLRQAFGMNYVGSWTMAFVKNDAYNEKLTYDKNGNILTLERTGELLSGQKNTIDDLTYSYNANQLLSVTDATNSTQGFNDANKVGNDYTYDVLGNLKTDKNKSITGIVYNHLNLPVEITFAAGKISYTYDAAGQKLKKVVQPTGGTAQTTDYVYGFQYLNGQLQFFPHSEGYVKPNGTNAYLYVYQYKDHLGNVRLSYADCDANGTINPATEILEENNYYPFGLQQQGYNAIVNSCRSEEAEAYKLNGKEYEDSFGLNIYEMDLRQLDPAIGRWVVQDPVIHHDYSPYSAFDNNPVYWSDPSGADAKGYMSGGKLVAAHFTGQEAIDAYNQLVNGTTASTIEIAVEMTYDTEIIPDGNGGGGDGGPKGNRNAVKIVRDRGEKVLNTQTNSLVRFWTAFSPREWTDPKTGMVYHVDADGKIIRLRPVGNSGALGFVSGAGGLTYVTYASKELQTLIATEKGAQSTQKVDKFIEMMNKGDYSLFAEPIYIYVYKGKQYILDGHHRIEAAIQSNKSIDIIILNTEKAMELFKNKVQEISKGLF